METPRDRQSPIAASPPQQGLCSVSLKLGTMKRSRPPTYASVQQKKHDVSSCPHPHTPSPPDLAHLDQPSTPLFCSLLQSFPFAFLPDWHTGPHPRNRYSHLPGVKLPSQYLVILHWDGKAPGPGPRLALSFSIVGFCHDHYLRYGAGTDSATS